MPRKSTASVSHMALKNVMTFMRDNGLSAPNSNLLPKMLEKHGIKPEMTMPGRAGGVMRLYRTEQIKELVAGMKAELKEKSQAQQQDLFAKPAQSTPVAVLEKTILDQLTAMQRQLDELQQELKTTHAKLNHLTEMWTPTFS